MINATFFHAGCPVCVAAEQQVLDALDRSRYSVESVHFANAAERLDEAERAGVTSVPALVIDGQVFHINFGASMADVRAGVAGGAA
jgi:glutaredoxin 3